MERNIKNAVYMAGSECMNFNLKLLFYIVYHCRCKIMDCDNYPHCSKLLFTERYCVWNDCVMNQIPTEQVAMKY